MTIQVDLEGATLVAGVVDFVSNRFHGINISRTLLPAHSALSVQARVLFAIFRATIN